MLGKKVNDMKKVSQIALMWMLVSVVVFAATTYADEMQVRHPNQSEMGKSARCPVTRSPFTVSDLTPVIDYQGKSYYFCCAGCVNDFKNNPTKFISDDSLFIRQPTNDEIGKTQKCPVSKEVFPVASDTQVIDYRGKSYFFCCPACFDEFKKDPEKFAK